jgi:hypothetical protein
VTAEQLADLYARLTKAKSDLATGNRPYLRGWNQAMDHAIALARAVFDDDGEAPE